MIDSANLESDDPEYVYHYTSGPGLLGIVERGEIWASKLHYLNDGQEFHYALELTRNSLRSWIDHGDVEVKVFGELSLIRIEGSRYINRVVACFSEEADLLSQWRAYCPPSGGYSLGFPLSELRQLASAQGFKIAKCIYAPSQQMSMISAEMGKWLEQFRSVYRESKGAFGDTAGELEHSQNPVRNLVSAFVAAIGDLASIAKHPSFAEEKEWRVISTRGMNFSELPYRPVGSLIVPYFGVKLMGADHKVPLEQVIVGPNPHPELAKGAVLGVLAKAFCGPVTTNIRASDTPFRTW